MSSSTEKLVASNEAIQYLQSDMTIGLGSGSTVAYFIKLLAREISTGHLNNIHCVATSINTENLANQANISILDPNQISHIDLTVDGADEFDGYLNLIKGGGGALLREKLIASISQQFIVITDSSKKVDQLGAFPLPVEVIALGASTLLHHFTQQGYKPKLRTYSNGKPYITDNGNPIIDLHLQSIAQPHHLANTLGNTGGVLSHGLFLNMADIIIMGQGNDAITFHKNN